MSTALSPGHVRRAVVAGCALGLAVGWNVSNLAPIATTLTRRYDVGLPTLGLFTTALFLMHLTFQIPGGRSSDRFGARRSGMVGLAVITAANAVSLVAPDPALGIAMRAVMGVGTGLGFIAASDYIRSSGGGPFAQGIYGGIAAGAGGIALAVVPPVETVAGWRAPFLSAIAVAALGGLLLATGPADRPHAERLHAHAVQASGLFRDRRLYRLATSHVVSFGLSIVIANWVVTLLRDHGLSKGAASSIGSLTLILGIFSRPLGGWIGRHRPSALRPAIAASFAAGSLGTLALAFSSSATLATAGAVVVGLAAGIPFAPAFTGAVRARPEAPATAIALVNGTAALLIVAGTPLAGVTFSLPGKGRIAFLAIACLWAGALLALPTRADLGIASAEEEREKKRGASPGR